MTDYMKKLCISLSLLLLSFFTAFAQSNRLYSIFRSMPAGSLYAPHAGSLEEDSVSIAGISFQGINASDANWLIHKEKPTENMRYSGKDVEAAIDVIYRTGAYKSIRYYLRGTQEPYNLLTDIEPGKLHQFNFGFTFDTEETAAMLLNVSLNKLKLYGPKLDIGYYF